MRWEDKEKVQVSEYAMREKSGFLFIPRWIAGQTRWLEWARWWELRYKGSWWFMGWRDGDVLRLNTRENEIKYFDVGNVNDIEKVIDSGLTIGSI